MYICVYVYYYYTRFARRWVIKFVQVIYDLGGGGVCGGMLLTTAPRAACANRLSDCKYTYTSHRIVLRAADKNGFCERNSRSAQMTASNVHCYQTRCRYNKKNSTNNNNKNTEATRMLYSNGCLCILYMSCEKWAEFHYFAKTIFAFVWSLLAELLSVFVCMCASSSSEIANATLMLLNG